MWKKFCNTCVVGSCMFIFFIFFIWLLQPINLISLILSRVRCGENGRSSEKKHLTTHKQNLACLACPERTQTHSGEMKSDLERKRLAALTTRLRSPPKHVYENFVYKSKWQNLLMFLSYYSIQTTEKHFQIPIQFFCLNDSFKSSFIFKTEALFLQTTCFNELYIIPNNIDIQRLQSPLKISSEQKENPSTIIEPFHEKTCFCHMRTTKARSACASTQSDQHLCSPLVR